MFHKILLGLLMFVAVPTVANATCGRTATDQATYILEEMMKHQGFVVPEEPPLDLGTPVTGTGASLVNRTYFSALVIYTKGSVSGFFQCADDGTLVIKQLSFGTTDGQIKEKTISFE